MPIAEAVKQTAELIIGDQNSKINTISYALLLLALYYRRRASGTACQRRKQIYVIKRWR